MSLNIELLRPMTVNVYDNGVERAATAQELANVYPYAPKSIPYWDGSITNNLTTMASHVPCDVNDGAVDPPTLYDMLWCRNGHVAGALISRLSSGVLYMQDHKDELEVYNPTNGWGDYHTLLKFAQDFMWACYVNPQAVVRTG